MKNKKICNDNCISGSLRRKQVKDNAWIVYNTPEMDFVQSYKFHYKSNTEINNIAEIYYPPDFNFDRQIPCILIFSIKKDTMYRGSYVSWAQLIASQGIAAITYEALDYENDFKNIVTYIYQNRNSLGLNNKAGVLAFCGPVSRYFKMKMDKVDA